jgi:hypothetical protein
MAITKQCKDCGIEKDAAHYWKQAGGTLQSYCKPCHSARAVKSQKKKQPKRLAKEMRICDVCGDKFLANKPWQKRCSHICGYTFQNKKNKKQQPNNKACARCSNSLANKKSNAIYCSKTCKSMDHTFKHRSKTRVLGVARRQAIYERDLRSCYMCLSPLEAKGFHLDHLVPVARGGDNSQTNLAVSCADCNKRRGTTIGVRQLEKLYELRTLG